MMKNNPEADRRLRLAAMRLDLSDRESLPMEKAYQEEEKSLWRRIMKRIRPQHGEWTRQDALYNIDHNPELALPLKALEAIDDHEKTAQTLAEEELKAQGVDKKIADKARPILEQIGRESYLNYTTYVAEKDEQYFQFFYKQQKKKLAKDLARKPFSFELTQLEKTARSEWSTFGAEQKMLAVHEWAIENASAAGIKHAPELVKAITNESKDPRELLSKLSLKDLINQVRMNLPAMMAAQPFDHEKIKAGVLMLARDKSNWLEPEEVAIIETILSQEPLTGRTHEQDVQALMIATMGIHVSWSAFQGPRSIVDQKELYDRAQAEKGEMLGADFARRYSNLRVIRPVNRTFAEMQISKFREGFGENSDNEKGMSMAIFEILKDLINIGLPESAQK